MHKYFILSLIVSIIPNLCLAENPRITKLMREKQAKMEQLEKCMGSSNGLKIAGISTLGLTAVGVAGNIAEAKSIQDYNDKIESTDKNIEKTKIEIQEKRDALDAKEEAEAKRIAAEEQAKREGRILRKVALEDIARINSSGFNGDKAVSHGYVPEKLPENLRSQFANAMVNFISRCRSLIGQNGIEDVSLSPTEQDNWRQYLGGTPLAEDTVLDDLNEHIIAECKIIKCNEKTHTLVNDGYGVRCDAKTVAGVPGADDEAENGEKGNQDDSVDENNAEDLKNGLKNKKTQATPETQPTVVADGTDCTADAKKTESDTEKAEYKGGVCKITKCKTSTKEPNKSGNKCVAKNVTLPEGSDCKASLNNPEVKKAKIEGGVCKIKSCVNSNKEVSQDGKQCVDKTVDEWTDEKKKSRKTEYCSKHFIENTVLKTGDPAYHCCLAMIEGRASNYIESKGTCDCKEGTKWHNNSCQVETIPINDFVDVKVSLEQGKKLAKMWAQKNGKNMTDTCTKTSKDVYSDWLKCNIPSGGSYEFKFDSLTEGDGKRSNKDIVLTVSKFMGISCVSLNTGVLEKGKMHCHVNEQECNGSLKTTLQSVNSGLKTSFNGDKCEVSY